MRLLKSRSSPPLSSATCLRSFYAMLDPTYAKNHIPIIASVSEHQPTTWSSYYFDLQVSERGIVWSQMRIPPWFLLPQLTFWSPSL